MKMSAKGALMATAVAGLFIAGFACKKEGDATNTGTAATSGGGDAEMVKCMGVNECKGQGACSAADGSHSCAGKNECKGKGWIKMSKSDCETKGGEMM